MCPILGMWQSEKGNGPVLLNIVVWKLPWNDWNVQLQMH